MFFQEEYNKLLSGQTSSAVIDSSKTLIPQVIQREYGLDQQI